MRTSTDIDDALLAEAMAATGQSIKQATVETALRTVVRLERQRTALRNLDGIGWDSDLDCLR